MKSDKVKIRIVEEHVLKWDVITDAIKRGYRVKTSADLEPGKLIDREGNQCIRFSVRRFTVDRGTAVIQVRSEWSGGFQIDEMTLQKRGEHWEIKKIDNLIIT